MSKLRATLLIISAIVVFGLIGHIDQQTEKLQQRQDLENHMAFVCSTHNIEINPDDVILCHQLIDQVQADGKHEVLVNSQGEFWTEVK